MSGSAVWLIGWYDGEGGVRLFNVIAQLNIYT